mgnify:CR=1 FL=1
MANTKEQFVEEYRKANITIDKNVPYKTVNGTDVCLDVIFGEDSSEKKRPAIIWIHGGAWNDHELDKRYRPDLELIKLVKKGYAAVCIDYRLSDAAPFPAQIQDCKCAVRYLRAHAQKWNIDTEKIGTWGESAGGHLAALLGTSSNCSEFEADDGWKEYPSHVNAVCEWYGPNDLTLQMDKDNKTVMQFMGNTTDSLKTRLQKASPIFYVNENTPPFLIMHGGADPFVPIMQSEIMVQALQEKSKNPVEYHVVPDQGHGFFKGEEPYKIVYNFFDRYLSHGG